MLWQSGEVMFEVNGAADGVRYRATYQRDGNRVEWQAQLVRIVDGQRASIDGALVDVVEAEDENLVRKAIEIVLSEVQWRA